MDNEPTAQPTQGQPDATATGPAANPATDNPPLAPTSADIDSLSIEQLDALLTGQSVTVEVKGGKAPTQEPTPTAPVTTTAEGTPAAPETVTPEEPASPTPTPTPEPEKDKGLRLRLGSLPELEQEAISLRTQLAKEGQPVSLAECITRVEAKYAGSKTPAPDAAPDAAETLRDQIAKTTAEIKEATEGGALLDTELLEKIESRDEQKRQLADLEKQRQTAADAAQQQVTSTFNQAREASRLKAIELYPEVADTNTPLGKRVREFINELQDPAHPDHEILRASNAPVVAAQMVAQELSVAPRFKVVTPAIASLDQLPAKVQPASGALRTAAPTPQATEAQVLAKLDTMSLDELDASQGGTGPAFYIR